MTLIALSTVAVASIIATGVTVARDGYRRVPTRR
jgi:hypothetical protein